MKTASSSFVILQKAKLSTRSVTDIYWCIWRTFWRKNWSERSPRDFDLKRQCPVSPGTCNPKETGLPVFPVSWSSTLFSGPDPLGLPPVPWTEEIIESYPFFFRRIVRCSHGDLVGEQITDFLSGLQKLVQRTKMFTELRGEYVELIPRLFAVDVFLLWSGYWLISTPSSSKVFGIYIELYVILNCVLLFFPVWLMWALLIHGEGLKEAWYQEI